MDTERIDRSFLELAYGNLIIPFCLVDPQGWIVYANRAELELLGYDRSEMEGQSAGSYFVNADHYQEVLRSWKMHQSVQDYGTSIRGRNGVAFRVRLSSCPFPSNPHFICVFKTNVDQYQRRSENLQILNNAIKELSQARRTDAALDKILKIVVPSLATWTTIDLIRDGELTALKIQHADNPTLAPAVDYKKNANSASDPGSFVYKSLHTGQVWYFPVVNQDILNSQNMPQETRDFLLQFNISSAIIVPMYYNDRIYGAMTFIETIQGKHYNEDDLVLFQNLANHIALVLENVRLNEEAQREIRQRKLAEKYFREIAEAVPQKILITDSRGQATYFNMQWEDFLGVNVQELLSTGWWSHVHPDDLDRVAEKWDEELEKDTGFELEHRLRRRDGTYRWQLTRSRPLKDESGKVYNWIASVTDIDEQKQAEEKKDEFITVASHELKTPLTSAKAYIQLLQKMVDPGQKHYSFLEKSTVQLKRLELLVNDLLDVSKIASGKIIYNMTEFDFSVLVDEVLENISHLHPEFELVLEHNQEFVFFGDRARMEQVLVNLLSNAVKYSGDSRKIVISSRPTNQWFLLTVEDFGIGISTQHMKDVFLRFFRVNNTYQGVGLGLFIANEIVETHQGRLEVESELGRGTTFSLKLPLRRIDAEEPVQNQTLAV